MSTRKLAFDLQILFSGPFTFDDFQLSLTLGIRSGGFVSRCRPEFAPWLRFMAFHERHIPRVAHRAVLERPV